MNEENRNDFEETDAPAEESEAENAAPTEAEQPADPETEALKEAFEPAPESPKKEKKKITVGLSVLTTLLAVLITFQIKFIATNSAYKAKYNELVENQTGMIPADSELFARLGELVALYEANYIGEIDQEKVIEYVLDAYVASIDKYGSYLTDEEFLALMNDYNAQLEGIGIHVIYNGDYGCIEIVAVMPDSPAMEAGVEPGDLIMYVEGQSVAELGYYPAINLIKGEKGTYTSFTVYRGENYTEVVEFKVMRDVITEQTVMHHVVSFDKTVGYIKIISFDSATAEQFKAAVEDLQKQGCTSLVLDVRYNPGGLLNSVVEILDYILPEGPIVRLVDNKGNEEVIDSDKKCLDMELVVLCNESTASAGELFTAAIKDYKKGLIVGTQTYGKGTVQTIGALELGGAVSISYKMYSPPYSDNYEGVGIAPDIVIELDEALADKNIYKITDDEDNQLKRAVEALKNGK